MHRLVVKVEDAVVFVGETMWGEIIQQESPHDDGPDPSSTFQSYRELLSGLFRENDEVNHINSELICIS